MSTETGQRAKILERVRALLSMTIENSCSENEAMTAADKAANLMEEWCRSGQRRAPSVRCGGGRL